MTSEQWTLVKSLFSEALDIDPDQRDEWLRSRAELPSSVIAEVLRLLAASETATSLASSNDAATHPTPAGELVGQTLLSRFEVMSLLGSGAMGDVYCAFDRSINETVAFKTVRPHLAKRPEVISSLTREVALARRVVHENVCQIRDLHAEPNPPVGPLLFFTMELLPGRTLAAQLAERALTVPETLVIAKGIANGIAAIHARSLIHRDLKPSNVFLVSSQGDAPRAVITDFGLCFDERRPVAETLTAFGPEAVVGTPAYMAPEQLLGKGATQQSDIYAFGVLLFEMVTGRLPFSGETPLAIALRRLQEDAPEPRTLFRQLPGHWNATIAACLERDPAKRPARVQDVIAALEGIKPVGRSTWSRRRLVAGTVSSIAAIVAGYEFWPRSLGTHVPNRDAVYYLKIGREYMRPATRNGIHSGVAEFKKAVAIDPLYGEAWAELADSYCMASTYTVIPSREALPLASEAAQRAIAINDRLAKAHGASAYVLGCDLKRWRSAEPLFKHAISLDPQDPSPRSWYAGFLGRACRFDEAVAMATSALALDPGTLRLNYRLATELLRAGQFERVRTQMLEFINMHPADGYGYCLLARAQEWLRNYADAEKVLKTAEELPQNTPTLNVWATLLSAEGRLTEAKEKIEAVHQQWLHQKEETNVYLYALGALYMANSDVKLIDTIADAMREAIRRQDETILATASNNYLRKLRFHPKLTPIFEEIGFPTQSGQG